MVGDGGFVRTCGSRPTRYSATSRESVTPAATTHAGAGGLARCHPGAIHPHPPRPPRPGRPPTPTRRHSHHRPCQRRKSRTDSRPASGSHRRPRRLLPTRDPHLEAAVAFAATIPAAAAGGTIGIRPVLGLASTPPRQVPRPLKSCLPRQRRRPPHPKRPLQRGSVRPETATVVTGGKGRRSAAYTGRHTGHGSATHYWCDGPGREPAPCPWRTRLRRSSYWSR